MYEGAHSSLHRHKHRHTQTHTYPYRYIRIHRQVKWSEVKLCNCVCSHTQQLKGAAVCCCAAYINYARTDLYVCVCLCVCVCNGVISKGKSKSWQKAMLSTEIVKKRNPKSSTKTKEDGWKSFWKERTNIWTGSVRPTCQGLRLIQKRELQRISVGNTVRGQTNHSVTYKCMCMCVSKSYIFAHGQYQWATPTYI